MFKTKLFEGKDNEIDIYFADQGCEIEFPYSDLGLDLNPFENKASLYFNIHEIPQIITCLRMCYEMAMKEFVDSMFIVSSKNS